MFGTSTHATHLLALAAVAPAFLAAEHPRIAPLHLVAAGPLGGLLGTRAAAGSRVGLHVLRTPLHHLAVVLHTRTSTRAACVRAQPRGIQGGGRLARGRRRCARRALRRLHLLRCAYCPCSCCPCCPCAALRRGLRLLVHHHAQRGLCLGLQVGKRLQGLVFRQLEPVARACVAQDGAQRASQPSRRHAEARRAAAAALAA